MAPTTVRIERGVLVEEVQRLSKAVATRSALPVLSGIQLSVSNRVFRMAATDLDTWLGVDLAGSAKVVGPSAVAVIDPKSLVTFAKMVPATKAHYSPAHDLIELRFEEDGELVISGTSPEAEAVRLRPSVSGVSPLDYAAIPSVITDARSESGHPWGAEHIAILRRLALAASADGARPILTGVSVTKSVAAATDSYRLGVAKRRWGIEALIPASALKLMSSDGVRITVVPEGRPWIVWTEDSGRWGASRLIEGVFPNYKALIPAAGTAGVVAVSLLAGAFNASMDRAVKVISSIGEVGSPVAARMDIVEGKFQVMVVVVEGKFQVMVVVADGRGKSVERLSEDLVPVGEIPADWPKIGFRPQYMTDAMKFLGISGEDSFTIEVRDPLKPGIFTSEALAAKGMTYLVMPVRW